MRTSLHPRFRALIPAVALALLVAGCSKEPTETLTILYSNDMKGEIRSCGCPVNDFGGLGRRATFVAVARDSTKNFLLVDAGDFFGTKLNYGAEKADLTMKSMVLMGYDAVVIGEKEMGFGIEYIVSRSQEIGLPVIAANLYDTAGDTLFFPPSASIEYPGGLTVGLIGVLGKDLALPPQVAGGAVRIGDPVAAVQRELAEMQTPPDLVVVLAHVNRRDAQRIAQEVPDVDLVVYGHEGRPMRSLKRFNNAFLLQVAEKGLYMGVAFAVLDGQSGIRRMDNFYPPLSLDYEDDEAIAKLFHSYDMSVAAKEKSPLPPAVYEARAGLKKPFAGSGACRDCHEEEFAVWEGSRHAHAFSILQERSRELDRDCIPCHTTGFYKRGGFEHLSLTPDLVDVGCEACHGNGHEHVKDPDKATEGDARGACGGCHDARQDPEFDFESHWDRIRH